MPTHAELQFRWVWELQAPPAALWPLVSNTDRFNRDCGYPPIVAVPPQSGEGPRPANTRRLRTKVGGVTVEWDELAFDWLAPYRYAVKRSYLRGPVARLVMTCELKPNGAGTTLLYDLRLTPSGWLGRFSLPFAIGRKARAITERVFRRYDEFALQGLRSSQLAHLPQLTPGGSERLVRARETLAQVADQSVPLVEKLIEFVRTADDFSVAQIRPYAVADTWAADRRETLKLFLHATRAGLLDFSWDLICPHCRGIAAHPPSLSGISSDAHCPSCQVDFVANFDQSVELTFNPNPAVRPTVRAAYCVGGPQVTPHIVAQEMLAPGQRHVMSMQLSPGRYRVRSPGLAQQQAFRAAPEGAAAVHVDLGEIVPIEPSLAPTGNLAVFNPRATEQLAVVESMVWSNHAVTGAEVTALQLFRDLFSHEVLRPGEKISVGSMTVVFTDLKNSTQLYRTIGDAPAFGRVLTHFEILKAAVAAENGAIVKTMGDAIMAVFPQPAAALRAMLAAQHSLAHPETFSFPAGTSIPASSVHPLALKAGLHFGPCLAINQNERLDYFGTTVNVAARLCGLCSGTDIVLSKAVREDPSVAAHFAAAGETLNEREERTLLKGLGEELFAITRVTNPASH